MKPKLSAVVRVDSETRRVRIVVTGHMNGRDQQGLHPLMRQVRTLAPGSRVIIDPSCAVLAEPAALVLLREAASHRPTAGPAGPVKFLPLPPDLERPVTGAPLPLDAEQPTQSVPTRRVPA